MQIAVIQRFSKRYINISKIGGITMLTNEKSTITIPVPAQYVSDNMIACVKKDDLKMLRFGDV